MILAKVTGSIVAGTRADKIDGPVYLIVTPCLPDGTFNGSEIIALDSVSAGLGEIVLVSQGSSTRQTPVTIDKPVDALIVGIVDSVEENGREVFIK